MKSVDDLWRMNELSYILPKLPPYAEAVVAENDPFNTPEDLAEAQAADTTKRMTVLPARRTFGLHRRRLDTGQSAAHFRQA